MRPRHADEIAAVLDVARSAGVPLTMRGAGTSIAGNAVGPGIVVDTSRHLNRVVSLDPEARTATVQPGRRARRAAAAGRAARAALRAGPVHAHPLHDRRDDRQQRLRLAGARLRPDRRQRRRAAGGARGRRRPGSGRRVGAVALTSLVDGHLAHVRSVRAVRAAGQRLLARAPAAGERPPARPVPGRLGGHPRRRARRHRRAGARRAAAAGGARLPVDGRGRRRGAGAAGRGRAADRLRGARLADRRRGACRRARRAPAAAGRRLAVRRGRARAASVPGGRRSWSAGRRRPGRGRGPVADPRGRCRAGRPQPGPAGVLRMGGRRRPARAARRLAARLRRAAAPSTGCAACPTATSATAACTSGSTSTSTTGAAAFRAFLVAGATALRAHGGSLSGEHGDGRARSELLPLMYDAESLRLFAAVKAICDPDRLLNPGVLVDPAPLDADLRPARPRSRRSATALRLTHDGGSLGDAVHRCTGVGKCVAPTAGRRDVPVVHRHPRREGLHPRPGPRAPGGARRLARRRAGRPRRQRGARPLPVLQGLRPRLPHRRRHGDVQVGGAAPAVRRPAAAAVALHAGPAAAVGRAGRADGRNSEPAGPRAARSAGQGGAGVDPRRSLPEIAPPLAAAGSRQLDRRSAARGHPTAGRVDLGGHVHRPLPPADRGGRDPGPRGRRADRGGHPDDACCALTWITTGQLDRARAIVARTVATLRRTSPAVCRSSGSSRPAWPPCAATRSS